MFTYRKCSLIHKSQVIFFSGIFAFCYHNRITDSSFSGRLLCYQIITWNIKTNYEHLNFVKVYKLSINFNYSSLYCLPIMPWAASSISSALYNNWTPPLGYFAKCPFPLPPASTYNHVIYHNQPSYHAILAVWHILVRFIFQPIYLDIEHTWALITKSLPPSSSAMVLASDAVLATPNFGVGTPASFNNVIDTCSWTLKFRTFKGKNN